MYKTILSFLTFLLSLNTFAFKYQTDGDCGGYPKVVVNTAPGFCLGLVYEPEFSNNGLVVPKKLRWSVELRDGSLLVTDIVSFGGQDGFIYRLDPKDQAGVASKELKVLLSHDLLSKLPSTDFRHKILYQPNQLLKWRDEKIYVGTSAAIFRFDPYAGDLINSIELIIDDIPNGGLHSLKSFAFDNEGNILLNVGSDSNVCQNFTRFADTNPVSNPANFKQQQFEYCPEVEDLTRGRGQIRKYFRNLDGSYSTQYLVFAKGLRNSIALAWNPLSNYLIQGENSRDAITKFAPELSNSDAPEDEINIIIESKHYGWPYCYANNLNSPEWTNIKCETYMTPQILLPAHSAPLGFIFYQGNLFPAQYKGHVIGSLHGYESKGHRIVTFAQTDDGKPKGSPLSLVFNWNPIGNQGKGKPVGLTELSDGSVLIVEDDPNNTILRLFYDKTQGDGNAVYEIDEPAPTDDELSPAQEEIRKNRLNQKTFGGNLSAFTKFEIKVIDKLCYTCHQTAGAPGVRLLRYDDEGNEKRISEAKKSSLILSVLKGNEGVPAMPPTGWDSPEQKSEAVKLVEEWLKTSSH
jgi:glucose/arabinose dehydrogenase